MVETIDVVADRDARFALSVAAAQDWQTALQAFIDAERRNAWIHGEGFGVCLRKSQRPAPDTGAMLRTLDIASVGAEPTGTDTFRDLLEAAQAIASSSGFDAIYVENVQTDQFAQLFRRDGWIEEKALFPGEPPCFMLRLNATARTRGSRFALRGFYSPALRAAEAVRQERATGAQWLAMIAGAPSVKQDELDWMGLEAFLIGGGRQWARARLEAIAERITQERARAPHLVEAIIDALEKTQEPEQALATLSGPARSLFEAILIETAPPMTIGKAEVLGFMRAHQISLDEVILEKSDESYEASPPQPIGAGSLPKPERWGDNVEEAWCFTVGAETFYAATFHDDNTITLISKDGLDLGEASNLAQVQHMAIGIHAASQGETHFAGYAIPGGKNYREILIRLPELGDIPALTPEQEERLGEIGQQLAAIEGETWADRFQLETDLRFERNRLLHRDPRYSSPHFQDQEIVYLRVDDRTTADGEKVLCLQEIQSDLHQSGRWRGYSEQEAQQKLADLETKIAVARDKTRRFGKLFAPARRYGDEVAEVADQAENELQKWIRRRDRLRALGPQVNAPLKGDLWLELALKRALLYAAEHGYDAITWARSDQIAYVVAADPAKLALQYDQKIARLLGRYTAKWGGRIEEARRLIPRLRSDEETGAAVIDISRPADVVSAIDTPDYIDPRLIALATARTQDHAIRKALDALVASIWKGADVRDAVNAMPTAAQTWLTKVFADEQHRLDHNPILRITPQMRAAVLRGQPLSARKQDGETVIEGRFGFDDKGSPFVHVAAAALDPGAVLRHETIHALKAMGLFTDAEWQTLEAAARQGNWIEKYGIRQHYDGIYQNVVHADDRFAVRRSPEYDKQLQRGAWADDIASLKQAIAYDFPVVRRKIAGDDDATRLLDRLQFELELLFAGVAGPTAFDANAALQTATQTAQRLDKLRLPIVKLATQWVHRTARSKDQKFSVRRDGDGTPGEKPDAALEPLLLEEAIAEAFSAWRRGTLPPEPAVAALFERILAFLERLGNALRDRGFRSAEDVFHVVDSGAIAARAGEDGDRSPASETGELNAELQTDASRQPSAPDQGAPSVSSSAEGAVDSPPFGGDGLRRASVAAGNTMPPPRIDSPAIRAVEAIPQTMASGLWWWTQISGAPGVAEDQIVRTGLKRFLTSGGRRRARLLDAIAEQVETTPPALIAKHEVLRFMRAATLLEQMRGTAEAILPRDVSVRVVERIAVDMTGPAGNAEPSGGREAPLLHAAGDAVGAEGQFDPSLLLISISTAALDPKGVLRHEAIHALRHLGLFKQAEWASLEEAAHRHGWLKTHHVRERWGYYAKALQWEAWQDDLDPLGHAQLAVRSARPRWPTPMPRRKPAADGSRPRPTGWASAAGSPTRSS